MTTKKVALITGASSGIGEALAHVHASRGGDLVVVARREAKLLSMKEEFREKYGVHVEVVAKDLSKRASPREIYAEVREKEITVDYLINNAGFSKQGHFREHDLEHSEAVIEVNVTALVALTRLLVADMVQRNSGRILNLSSMAAYAPGGPLQIRYYTTKAFILSFSQGLAIELEDTNVTVTALCPGAIDTEFEKAAGMEKTKLFAVGTYPPEQVATEGYEAMLRGDLVKKSCLSFANRTSMAISGLLPAKGMLRYIKELQTISE
jgi:short-subunit dehydrogenase